MNLKQLCFVHDTDECKGNLLPDCLYVSEEGKLVIVGHCALCGSHIQVSITIEDLIVKIPAPSKKKPVKPTLLDPKVLQDDANFLRLLGIDPDPPKQIGGAE